MHPYFQTIEGMQVSVHLLILRSGEVLQFVNFNDRAWHAGRSSYLAKKNVMIIPSGLNWKAVMTCRLNRHSMMPWSKSPPVCKTIIPNCSSILPDIRTLHRDVKPIRDRILTGVLFVPSYNIIRTHDPSGSHVIKQ